ncbi:MAG: hypothetical protein COV76_04360 [Candidatus Omnitrophica bacterium CG11_big_fil_rev_8_21_14_0_20_64_10]|nr:MAG: hypothetical protein COV76_04360 [Candidatus Omnitrophica bacterium CG11_big_fil_rev_8_21_14_0_20_64_10]
MPSRYRTIHTVTLPLVFSLMLPGPSFALRPVAVPETAGLEELHQVLGLPRRLEGKALPGDQAGLEAEEILQDLPDSNLPRLVLRLDEQGAAWTRTESGPFTLPGGATRPELPAPPAIIARVGESEGPSTENWDQFLELLAATGQDLRSGRSYSADPILEYLRAELGITFRGDYGEITDYSQHDSFVEALTQQVFYRHGETYPMSNTRTGGRAGLFGAGATRFRIDGDWEQVPYLGGEAVYWLARGTRIEGIARGITKHNLALYDPAEARESAQTLRAAAFNRTAATPIQLEARRLIPDLDEEEFLDHFGEAQTREEERQHAKDFAWACRFFGRDLREHPYAAALEAEAVIRPGSFMDREFWTPAKRDQDVGAMVRRAAALVELFGQVGRVLAVMRELPEEDWDRWAYAVAVAYLLHNEGEFYETLGQAGPVRSSGSAAGRSAILLESSSYLLFSLVKRSGFRTSDQLLDQFKQPDADGVSRPGRRAQAWFRQLYDDNAFNDATRQALLESEAAAATPRPRTDNIDDIFGSWTDAGLEGLLDPAAAAAQSRSDLEGAISGQRLMAGDV